MDTIEEQVDHVIAALEHGLELWSSTDRDGYNSGYSHRDGTFYSMLIHASDEAPFSTPIEEEQLRINLRKGLRANPELHIHGETGKFVADARAHLHLVQDGD